MQNYCVDKRYTPFLKYFNDKLTVKYVGKGDQYKQITSIRSNKPASNEFLIFFYEVRINNIGERGDIVVGFASKDFPINKHPGLTKKSGQSFGYKSDGKIITMKKEQKKTLKKYQTGDYIGCGINFLKKQIFFTHNKKYLGPSFQDINLDGKEYYPTIGLHSHNESVTLNFGQKQFEFDIHSHVLKEKQEGIIHILSQKITNFSIHNMVQEYLYLNGYIETLKAFEKNSTVSHECPILRKKEEKQQSGLSQNLMKKIESYIQIAQENKKKEQKKNKQDFIDLKEKEIDMALQQVKKDLDDSFQNDNIEIEENEIVEQLNFSKNQQEQLFNGQNNISINSDFKDLNQFLEEKDLKNNKKDSCLDDNNTTIRDLQNELVSNKEDKNLECILNQNSRNEQENIINEDNNFNQVSIQFEQQDENKNNQQYQFQVEVEEEDEEEEKESQEKELSVEEPNNFQSQNRPQNQQIEQNSTIENISILENQNTQFLSKSEDQIPDNIINKAQQQQQMEEENSFFDLSFVRNLLLNESESKHCSFLNNAIIEDKTEESIDFLLKDGDFSRYQQYRKQIFEEITLLIQENQNSSFDEILQRRFKNKTKDQSILEKFHSEVQDSMKILKHIKNGSIEKANNTILNKLGPAFFEQFKQIQLQMHILQFIEYIKEHDDEKAIEFSQEILLKYENEEIMGLLCYENPYDSPLNPLLKQSYRNFIRYDNVTLMEKVIKQLLCIGKLFKENDLYYGEIFEFSV